MTPAAGSRIRESAREAIIAHARAEAPLECCGLLLGVPGVVEEACRTRNMRRSETAYLVDPADHFAVIRKGRRNGREILGAYHSHPRSPAVPSATDLRDAWDARFLYVIVSLADPHAPDVRGYYLQGGAFVDAPLATIA
ncbi:MAG: M67 family metallopeptidase [Acidobacteriota bacterium]|nr:M67 family metallopeptidase [Acidobacteriota bacterium]